MCDANSAKNQQRIDDLISTYLNTPQIGLFLGAGVTACSDVPTYEELALRILELASDMGYLPLPRQWVQTFVLRQRELLNEHLEALMPQQIVMYVQGQLHRLLGKMGDMETITLRWLLWAALYGNLYEKNLLHNGTVSTKVFAENATLNAVLTFCAARPDSVLASRYCPPASENHHRKTTRKIETNMKVGGILTTNYDNLVEGAFHQKYGIEWLLKPVGRPRSEDVRPDKRVIPVYHIHGYVHYVMHNGPADRWAGSDTVISEADYFRSFYDPLGFGNYMAMSFLRRFPCLFIGASMKDQNLRRFLFHLTRDADGQKPPSHQRKFAILPTSGNPEDDLMDDMLHTFYGVDVIWIESFDKIGDILRQMYEEVPGVDQDVDWEHLYNYRWWHKAAPEEVVAEVTG